MELDKWQRVSISRMERSVYLYLEGQEGSTTVDPGEQGVATQLSLSHWLWLGGLEDMMGMLPASLAVSSQFHGCIQKVFFYLSTILLSPAFLFLKRREEVEK